MALVFSPKQETQEQEKFLAKISEAVIALKGKVKKTDDWGKKTLAYPIKRFEEGVFYLLELDLPPEAVLALDKKIKTEEDIIRYLLVKVE